MTNGRPALVQEDREAKEPLRARKREEAGEQERERERNRINVCNIQTWNKLDFQVAGSLIQHLFVYWGPVRFTMCWSDETQQ